MATADELLNNFSQTVDETLVVDLNTRLISIPASVSILGVESDDDVKRLRFKLPRYYGEHDLSTFDFRINFENASGVKDLYLVDDIEITDNTAAITFSWLVDRTAFTSYGDVEFSVCMKKYGSDGSIIKELNTAISSLAVLKGLESDKAVVSNDPSAFDQVLFRLYAVEAATGLGRDGYYSIVKVEESDNSIVLTIINQDGKTQATIRNGIEGKDGKDGYSPVKGVDYWTNEERASMTNEVLTHSEAYISSWAPVSTTIVLNSDNWHDRQQTITIDGVTENSIVIVAPDPTEDTYYAYVESGVRCVSQNENQLTFVCEYSPSISIPVNVAVQYSTAHVEPPDKLIITDDGNGNVIIS